MPPSAPYTPNVPKVAVALASMVRTKEAIPDLVTRLRQVEGALMRAALSDPGNVEADALECVACPGTPDEVVEATLGFRDYVGDYQRQLFLVDHAGLPLKTVLEQLDLLGEEVVPVLRKEFAARRGPVVALDDVDLSIARGSIHGIVGRSGAGKSTLVALLLRLHDVERGAVRVDGHDVRAEGAGRDGGAESS